MAISVHEHDGVVIVDAVLHSGLQTGALVQQRVVKKKKNVKLGCQDLRDTENCWRPHLSKLVVSEDLLVMCTIIL